MKILKKVNQKTINKTILCCGAGIHSGKKVNIKIVVKEDYGIVLKDDLKKQFNKGDFRRVSSTESTEINNNVSVNTVEH